MTRTEEIERAKSVPLTEVADRLNLAHKAADKYACVECSSSDALSIKPKNARAKCYSCGKSWDGIGLVQAANDCSFSEAYRWLCGQDVTFTRPESPKHDPQTAVEVRRAIWEAFGSNKRRDVNPLGEGLSARAIAYLNGRGISSREYVISAHAAFWRGLPNRFTHDELHAAGLITQKGKLHLGWVEEMLLFGYFDANGELETFRARPLMSGSGPKVWSLCGDQPSYPFGWPDQVAGERLYVVEGELDAMSLWSIGRSAIAVPGTNGWLAAWSELLRPIDRVMVLRDGDAAGKQMLADIATTCAHFKERISALAFPPGQDANDLLQAGDLERVISDIERNHG